MNAQDFVAMYFDWLRETFRVLIGRTDEIAPMKSIVSDYIAAEAQRKRDALQGTILRSQEDIDQKIDVRNSVSERLAALELQLTKVSQSAGNSCKPVLADGKPVIGDNGKPLQACSIVPLVNQTQLKAVNAQIASTKKELDVAESAVKQAREDAKKNDPRLVEEELNSAEAAHRVAVNNSQLHSYTSMFTGKAVADVTDAEVKNLEKYLVIIPSIAAAFACSTFIGIAFGFLPACNAAGLDPVEALARE